MGKKKLGKVSLSVSVDPDLLESIDEQVEKRRMLPGLTPLKLERRDSNSSMTFVLEEKPIEKLTLLLKMPRAK